MSTINTAIVVFICNGSLNQTKILPWQYKTAEKGDRFIYKRHRAFFLIPP